MNSIRRVALKLIRYQRSKNEFRMGLWQGRTIHALFATSNQPYTSFSQLLQDSIRENIQFAEFVASRPTKREPFHYRDLDQRSRLPHLVIPLDPPEVWGAGITYLRSRDAREEETQVKGIYDHVYEAPRPEVFFKGTGLRCAGPNEPIRIRSDSNWTVPEPELALVLDSYGDVLGYTIGNDVSARDIEGENPLYLPQAKIYQGSCAIGPAILLANGEKTPVQLIVRMTVYRRDRTVYVGQTNTVRLKRSFQELITHLLRDNVIPGGTVYLTGTGIVPPDHFALRQSDLVEIEIEEIGVLRNPVT